MLQDKFKKRGTALLLVGVGIIAGILIHTLFMAPPSGHEGTPQPSTLAESPREEVWTCSMHPQIKLPKPGKCPLCSMDLILLENGGDVDDGEREISISPYAAKLIEVETSEVTRHFLDAEVRMVGKVDFDETRVSNISAWVPGRLDRLFVNYTGIKVKKGDHMVEIYSPDLLTAQEELIQALNTVKTLKQSKSRIVRRTAESTVTAAREKLRLLGLTSKQIRRIETRRKASDTITINAPAAGVVILKNAQEGMYVKTGTKIYTIADLSSVWIKLDAYESDLAWIRYGGKVEFTTETYPGKIFKGTISFIDPVIDPVTRTAKVRVTVPNKNLSLKPGMFVHAVVRSKVGAEGYVVNTDLTGKWIGPMHPEIIKDKPGICDICEMPLVSAESLGYAGQEQSVAPLVIPVTAALKTGKRTVVYLERSEMDRPTYEGREIVIGPRLGHFYVVKEGLREGERVVSRGAFKLDAEMQIQAKPSMMYAGGVTSSPSHAGKDSRQLTAKSESPGVHEPLNVPGKFRVQLGKVVNAYFEIQRALADDNSKMAGQHAISTRERLSRWIWAF